MADDQSAGGNAGEIENIGDLQSADATTQFRYWMREIEDSQKASRAWVARARRIEERYRDERSRDDAHDAFSDKEVQVKGVNILYANTETMKSAVYANPPVPIVERRYPGEDKATRVAVEVLERALAFVTDDQDLHGLMKRIRLDYLLPGRGVARAYYEFDSDAESSQIQTIEQESEPQELPAILDQRVSFSRLPIADYLESTGSTTYSTLRWQAFRSRMTAKAMARRFGAEKAQLAKPGVSLLSEGTSTDGEDINKALASVQSAWKLHEVWEIWDKARRLVWFICPGYDQGPLDVVEDPLRLSRFFPAPEPAIAVESNESRIPVPLYWLYQDQAAEIDRLTKRIYSLVDGIRVNGLFAGEHKNELNKLFSADNQLIGISDFAALMDKGGLSKLVEWLPIEPIARAVQALYEARERAKQELFEISGMADIIRGSSDPRETLGAQRIKGQFATIRLEDHQNNLAKFAEGMLEIAGEIISEMFEPEILERMTNMRMPRDAAEKQIGIQRLQIQAIGPVLQQIQSMQVQPEQVQQLVAQATAQIAPQIQELQDAVTWEDVLGILRADDVRRYSIRIETDSTIKMDQERERQERVAAIEAVSQALSVFGPAVMGGHMPFDLFKKLLTFLLRGFPGSREVEAILDEWQQPQPQQQEQEQRPDPAVAAKIREEGQMQRDQMRLQALAQENDKDRQFKASEAEKDRSLDVLAKTIAAAKAVADAGRDRRNAQAKMRAGDGA